MIIIGKQLITKKNFQEFISSVDKKIYITKEMILTPGAKDEIRNLGIVICFDVKPEKIISQIDNVVATKADKVDEKSIDESKIANEIVMLLTSQYHITDVDMIGKVVAQILKRI